MIDRKKRIEKIFGRTFSLATRVQLLWKGTAFLTRLFKAGIEIYTYCGEMLHAKTYLFDQSWCIIGSTNLDSSMDHRRLP